MKYTMYTTNKRKNATKILSGLKRGACHFKTEAKKCELVFIDQ